jgi:uncharacterized membrane protein
MYDYWIMVAIIIILVVLALAVFGIIAFIRLLTQKPASTEKSEPSSTATGDIRQILRQHEERIAELEKKAGFAKHVSVPATPPPIKTPVKSEPQKPKISDRTLEEAVAGRWFQWIALAALLFGMGYFLKLAFENNWIGPMGRVALGWIVGAAFLVQGHRWFTKYPVWAHSLAGGGLGFLYLSTYASFQFYQILDSETAFGVMILTTAAGSVMAAADRSPILAIFASLGGFLTPMLVSTGEDHQAALMIYLLILNGGIFFLSLVGGWRYLRWGGALFTFFYCAEWAQRFYQPDKLWPTLGFHSAFFLLFAATSWLQDFQKRKDADSADALFSILSAGVYYASSYAMLTNINFHGEYDLAAALLAIALSALYAWQSMRILNSKTAKSTYLSTILLGLAVAFFAVAIPAYLNKGWITLGWSVEAVLLVWTGLRESRPATRLMAYAIMALAAFRLVFIDWNGTTPTLIWNDRLIPYGATLASIVWVILLLNRAKSKADEAEMVVPILAIAGNLVALLYLSLEVADYWNRQAAVTLWNAKALSLSVLWLLYAGGMMAAGFFWNQKGLRLVAIMTFWVTILKVFIFDLSELQGASRVLSLIILGLILLAVSFAYQNRSKKAEKSPKGKAS